MSGAVAALKRREGTRHGHHGISSAQQIVSGWPCNVTATFQGRACEPLLAQQQHHTTAVFSHALPDGGQPGHPDPATLALFTRGVTGNDMRTDIRPLTREEREYLNRDVMQEDILQLARAELESLNEMMDSVLQIPHEAFRELGSCGLLLAMAKHQKERGGSESHPILNEADDQFDKLCSATPNMPREAVRIFSLAYIGLVSLFFDERFTPHPSGMGALKTLMLIREQKGFILGMVTGTASSDSQSVKAARSMMAKSGAAMRHAENHAMKAMVFDWLDANFTPGTRSMDDVAQELAGRIVPAKFRTVRDWLTEWKKLRSTGTA